jgi:hypothetical protein
MCNSCIHATASACCSQDKLRHLAIITRQDYRSTGIFLYMVAMTSALITLLTPDQNVPFFNLNVPEKIQKALLQRILQCYRDASQHCYKHFRPAQAKDVSGHYRRGRIEDEMIGVAERFRKDGVTFNEVPYKRNTGHHVELRSGMVTFTESCVLFKDDLPREADFRETLASTGQREMFAEGKDEEVEPGTTLYAVLLHGVGTGSKRERCAFASIRFPAKNFRGYLGGTVDLFNKFPEFVQEFYADSAEQQDTELKVIRRKKQRGASA